MDLDPAIHAAMLAALPQLRAFAMSLCRDFDWANDLAQEALLRAWTNIERFEPGSNMGAWLTVILRNQYYSEYRKRRREVEDVDGSYAGSLVVPADQIARLEFDDLCRAIAELPDEMREALSLIAVDGISYEAAAQAFNCSVGTVKSRVHRARVRLAARVSRDRMAERRRSDRPSVIDAKKTERVIAAI